MRAAQQPSLLGWFRRIRPFTDRDPHPSERSILPRKRTDVLSRGVGMRGPSTGHAARFLTGPRQLDTFNTRSYRSLLPRPLDNRVLGELTLSHHATTGVAAYAVNPKASNGAFHLRYDGTTGVMLPDEPQLLAVNLVCNSGSSALTGHYIVGILPQPDFPSGQKHFCCFSMTGSSLNTDVVDLEPGDLEGVADAPLLRVPLGALQHPTHAAGPHPGQTSDSRVSAVARSPDTGRIAPDVPCRRPRRP